MGFHMYIHCIVNICKDTGRHFYYGRAQDELYTMPKPIPEPYREFVQMRRKIYRIYAQLVTDEICTCVDNFVDKFPEWSDIIADSEFDESWTEDMHNRFYNALKWFSEQEICYMISWS